MAHEAMLLGIERAKVHGLAAIALRDAHMSDASAITRSNARRPGSSRSISSMCRAMRRSRPMAARRRGSAPIRSRPVSAQRTRRRSSSISPPAAGRSARCGWRGTRASGLPDGILLDPAGQPTNDPALLFADPAGALLPFGEHKGFGLGLACELLAGALIGATRRTAAAPTACRTRCSRSCCRPKASRARLAMRSASRGSAAGSRGMGDGSAEPAPGGSGARLRAQRMAQGLPIDEATWDLMVKAAAGLGVALGEARSGGEDPAPATES